LRAGLLLVPRILLLSGIASRSAAIVLGMLLRRIFAPLIVRSRCVVGRPPRLRAIAALLQPSHQIGQALAQVARQSRIRRAHRDVQFAGSFAQADLHARLILVSELERNIAYGFTRARMGLVLRLE